MLGGSIDIPAWVKKYIHKLLVHEATVTGHDIEEIDLVIRYVEGEDKVWSYSRRDSRWIRELTDRMIEEILTK